MVVFNQDIYLVDPIGNRFADIIFPAATWGEDTFTRANGERRVRLYQKFYDAPGDAKPDWWIIAQLAKRMGFEGLRLEKLQRGHGRGRALYPRVAQGLPHGQGRGPSRRQDAA